VYIGSDFFKEEMKYNNNNNNDTTNNKFETPSQLFNQGSGFKSRTGNEIYSLFFFFVRQ